MVSKQGTVASPEATAAAATAEAAATAAEAEDAVENMDSSEGEARGVDYYYLKALDYLSSSAESGGADSCPLHSPSSSSPSSSPTKEEEEMADNFSLNFRPGLTHDETHSTCSSASRGSEVSSSHSSSSSTIHRERKLSIGCKAYQQKTAGMDPRVRRKLSDGHVHWADEFQKDLTRCHPRKQYSRHPSHHASQVKPILKAASGDCGEEDQ